MDMDKSILAIAAMLVGAPALAGGTPAGTNIDNVATASWGGPSGPSTVTSNVVSLRVDELLDVVVASTDPGPVSAPSGSTGAVLRFQMTNSGNGTEAFPLAATGAVGGDDFDPAVTSVVIDSNGNGAYDAGTDTVYVAGSNDPVLAPDASVTVFVLSTMPSGGTDAARGAARLTATAVTGTGTPGTTFAGKGAAGGDALVGATTARAAAEGVYVLQSVSVAFVKSASVLDPFGGTRAVPGSIVTYSLVATLTGSGSISNLKLSDAVPAETVYVAGSLTLDGSTLTDAADGDAGAFGSGAIAVTLPSAAAGSRHSATFKVKIN